MPQVCRNLLGESLPPTLGEPSATDKPVDGWQPGICWTLWGSLGVSNAATPPSPPPLPHAGGGAFEAADEEEEGSPWLDFGEFALALATATLSTPQLTHYVLDAYIWRMDTNPRLKEYLLGAPPPKVATVRQPESDKAQRGRGVTDLACPVLLADGY